MEANIKSLKMEEQKQNWFRKHILMILILVNTLPTVLAYTTPIQIPTIWDVLVEYTFGSFWVSVAFLILVYGIILALGGVGLLSNILFNGLFLLCMALGYYNPLIAFAIILVSIIFGVFGTIRFLSGQ